MHYQFKRILKLQLCCLDNKLVNIYNNNMKINNYSHNKNESLSTGIGAFCSSFLFCGSSVLIYFLKLHKNTLSRIDSTFLWICAVILFLSGVSLFFWGLYVIIYNIKLIIKRLPRQKEENSVWINTNLVSGILALVVSLIFTLTAVFFYYPRYMLGTTDIIGLIFFIVGGALFFIYATFVFIYNIFKKD